MNNQLALAIQIASTVHVNQLDKGGKPYILHPLRIMMRLRTQDEELMCMAVLHDVVEDSTMTIQQLTDLGFTKRVTDALSLLTHDPSDPYDTYIKRISTSSDATKIKLEDLRDNSDITRLKGISQKDMDRLSKYTKAFTFLSGVAAVSSNVGYR